MSFPYSIFVMNNSVLTCDFEFENVVSVEGVPVNNDLVELDSAFGKEFATV